VSWSAAPGGSYNDAGRCKHAVDPAT